MPDGHEFSCKIKTIQILKKTISHSNFFYQNSPTALKFQKSPLFFITVLQPSIEYLSDQRSVPQCDKPTCFTVTDGGNDRDGLEPLTDEAEKDIIYLLQINDVSICW